MAAVRTAIPVYLEVFLPPRLSWIPAFAGMTAPKVIPAEAGIHTALTEDERTVAGTAAKFPARQRGQVP